MVRGRLIGCLKVRTDIYGPLLYRFVLTGTHNRRERGEGERMTIKCTTDTCQRKIYRTTGRQAVFCFQCGVAFKNGVLVGEQHRGGELDLLGPDGVITNLQTAVHTLNAALGDSLNANANLLRRRSP